jgi:hypothetical protein
MFGFRFLLLSVLPTGAGENAGKWHAFIFDVLAPETLALA